MRARSLLLVLSAAFLAHCGGEPESPTAPIQPSHPSQPSQGIDKQDYQLAINWENLPEGRIFQRDASGSYALLIEGTFANDAPKVEARVVTADEGEQVTNWTEIASTPQGGKFSGTLAGIPQGGWYQLQVRVDEDNTTDYRDSSRFGVGVLFACLGQSHIDGWFDPALGEPEKPAEGPLRMYRHEQVRQGGPAWEGWQPVTGLAATVFAERVYEAMGVPVGMLDYGVLASSLWQANALMKEFGWWLPDDSGSIPESNNYAVFMDGLEVVGRDLEGVLWIQGHTDAMRKESTAHYREGLRAFLGGLRQDVQNPTLPVFFSLVTRQGDALGPGTTTPDEDIQAIRDAEQLYIDEDPYAYLATTTMDLPLDDGEVHHAPEGQILQAERMALTAVSVLGDPPTNTYRGPAIVGYSILDAQTLDVTIAHVGGDDFTPAQDIKGFRVLGSDVGEIASATRQDANTIRIVVSGSTSDIDYVDYLYGGNPGSQDLFSYVAAYVHDNTAHRLPLEGGVVPALR